MHDTVLKWFETERESLDWVVRKKGMCQTKGQKGTTIAFFT